MSWETVVADRKRLKLPKDELAALVGVHSGDVVVNTRAKHWTGGTGECDCGWALETEEHRWWGCPLSDAIRNRMLGPGQTQMLAKRLPRVRRPFWS